VQLLNDQHWHALPCEEVVDLLETDATDGLGQFAVKHRLEQFGPNTLTPPKGKSALLRFLLQFHNPLVYILNAAGVVTLLLGDYIDAVVIFGVVLVNAAIGYVQEAKAVSAIEALSQSMTTGARVVREGETLDVPATEIVPGDLVLLQAGDKVPADLRLLRTRDLRIDESALTGESVAVEKDTVVSERDTTLADRTDIAYASSLVTYGTGAGLVIATGDSTEVGRISRLIAEAEDLQTPLTKKIAAFSRILLIVILALGAVTFVVGMLRGETAAEMFKAAVALAVGAIPEGLPAAVTITLAIGVNRMARRRAIIRHLPAVETLGSTTVICSDKTGTLTENQMTVQRLVAGGRVYAFEGSGYAPHGAVALSPDGGGGAAAAGESAARASGAGELVAAADPEVGAAPARPPDGGLDDVGLEVLRAGLLCNDSRIFEEEGRWLVQGDPTEGALVTSALKAGLEVEAVAAGLPRLDAIPFESEHQYMATLHATAHDAGGRRRLIYAKGAAEVMLDRCTTMLGAGGEEVPLDRQSVHAQVEELAAEGLRVLAFARGQGREGDDDISHDEVEGLTFLGLQAMIDPPRPEAIAAVAACKQAGIVVKMITGDHGVTAAAIARQMGLLDGAGDDDGGRPGALTGAEMAALKDREFITAAHDTDVFARVTPEQKLRLVEALQSRGDVVAMTGDGVNDAPALKQADIGVAMGVGGTDVAKDAADMVLTDDNFASIEAAVEEGRGVFDNLTKFITWTLPTNLGEGLVILAAVFLGTALPILPVQILWINMTTAVLLGLMLAFEPKEHGIMGRPPRRPGAPILSAALIRRILLVGALLLGAAFGLFEWASAAQGTSLDVARTIAVNVFVVVEIFYLFNCRSLTRSVFRIHPLSNRWVLGGVAITIALQLMYTYAPFMHVAFQSAPLTLEHWSYILAAGVATLFIVEFEKWLVNRRSAGRVP
jgi:Ca2+-transporting ATPase